MSGQEKTTFREIALGHMKKILEMSTTEFTPSYQRVVVQGDASFKEYVPSTSKAYIQAVESFRNIMIPHFDEKMTKKNDEIMKELSEVSSKVLEQKRKRVKEEFEYRVELNKDGDGWNPVPCKVRYERNMKLGIASGDIDDKKRTRMKVEIMSVLFQELNLLLKRNDYLKSSIYSEEDFEEDDLEEESKDE